MEARENCIAAFDYSLASTNGLKLSLEINREMPGSVLAFMEKLVDFNHARLFVNLVTHEIVFNPDLAYLMRDIS